MGGWLLVSPAISLMHNGETDITEVSTIIFDSHFIHTTQHAQQGDALSITLM
jgi:hypothetical protein